VAAPDIDEIGPWSEVKLDIVREFAQAYSRILSGQKKLRNVFGYEEKTNNEAITEAFRERLLSIAGFKHVSRPLAMRNSRDAVVDYLFFASPKPVALETVDDIFKKHEKRL
jgi:hypothetical protein